MTKVIRLIGISCLLFIMSPLSITEVVASENEQNAEEKIKTGMIKDMVLIYDGGAHRSIKWTKEMFEPYVSLENETGEDDWLFDGFLFLEIHDGTHSFASGYKPIAAHKKEWIGLIEHYLKEGNGIKALNECIGDAKEKCYKPFKKRKIVVSLPEPIPGQTDWGELDGVAMDFNNDEHRVQVCKWYIDYVTKRFKEEKFKNVELSGFYWLAEEATHTRTFVSRVADYIHEKKASFYWIPYFNSDGYTEWKTLGFDQAFLQPNHFFNDKIPNSRIDDACNLAKNLGMSMEMEFDDRALEKYDWGYRLEAYIDGFERNNVMEDQDIAYYQGGDAFYKLKNGSEKDRALFKRLAGLIAKRQKAAIGKK